MCVCVYVCMHVCVHSRVPPSLTVAVRGESATDQLHVEDMLIMEANGEPNAELTRADFLVAVLKSYGIVDEEVSQ